MEIEIKCHWKRDAEKNSCIHQLCKEELVLYDVTVVKGKGESNTNKKIASKFVKFWTIDVLK